MSASEPPSSYPPIPPLPSPPRHMYQSPSVFSSEEERVAYLTSIKDTWESRAAAQLSDDDAFGLISEYALHGWHDYINQVMMSSSSSVSTSLQIKPVSVHKRNMILNTLFTYILNGKGRQDRERGYKPTRALALYGFIGQLYRDLLTVHIFPAFASSKDIVRGFVASFDVISRISDCISFIARDMQIVKKLSPITSLPKDIYKEMFLNQSLQSSSTHLKVLARVIEEIVVLRKSDWDILSSNCYSSLSFDELVEKNGFGVLDAKTSSCNSLEAFDATLSLHYSSLNRAFKLLEDLDCGAALRDAYSLSVKDYYALTFPKPDTFFGCGNDVSASSMSDRGPSDELISTYLHLCYSAVRIERLRGSKLGLDSSLVHSIDRVIVSEVLGQYLRPGSSLYAFISTLFSGLFSFDKYCLAADKSTVQLSSSTDSSSMISAEANSPLPAAVVSTTAAGGGYSPSANLVDSLSNDFLANSRTLETASAYLDLLVIHDSCTDKIDHASLNLITAVVGVCFRQSISQEFKMFINFWAPELAKRSIKTILNFFNDFRYLKEKIFSDIVAKCFNNHPYLRVSAVETFADLLKEDSPSFVPLAIPILVSEKRNECLLLIYLDAVLSFDKNDILANYSHATNVLILSFVMSLVELCQHKDVFLKFLYRKLSRRIVALTIDDELLSEWINCLKVSISPVAAQDLVTLRLAYRQVKESSVQFEQFHSSSEESAKKIPGIALSVSFVNSSTCNTQQIIDRVSPHITLHPELFPYLERYFHSIYAGRRVEFPLTLGSCDVEISYPGRRRVTFVGLTPLLALVLLAFNYENTLEYRQKLVSGGDSGAASGATSSSSLSSSFSAGSAESADSSYLTLSSLRLIVLGHCERSDKNDELFVRILNNLLRQKLLKCIISESTRAQYARHNAGLGLNANQPNRGGELSAKSPPQAGHPGFWDIEKDIKACEMKLYTNDCLFQINRAYESKRKRVEIAPMILEADVTNINTQRSLQVDAWVMQIMKAKRRLAFPEMFSDIQKKQQASRQLFPLDSRMVLSRLDKLIEQEFIERSSGSVDAAQNVFVYLG